MISSRLTQRGRGLYLTALLIDEGEETFVGEIFLGDFLYLLRGDFVYLLVEMLDVLEPAIMEVALAEVEGEVLTVVAGHAYLALDLFLGSLELRIAQWLLLFAFLASC